MSSVVYMADKMFINRYCFIDTHVCTGPAITRHPNQDYNVVPIAHSHHLHVPSVQKMQKVPTSKVYYINQFIIYKFEKKRKLLYPSRQWWLRQPPVSCVKSRPCARAYTCAPHTHFLQTFYWF